MHRNRFGSAFFVISFSPNGEHVGVEYSLSARQGISCRNNHVNGCHTTDMTGWYYAHQQQQYQQMWQDAQHEQSSSTHEDTIFLLQEIPNWRNGLRTGGTQLYGGNISLQQRETNPGAHTHSTTDIHIPKDQLHRVMAYRVGRHWTGLCMGQETYISAHFLWGEHDNSDELTNQISAFITHCNSKCNTNTRIIMVFDANTTLPREWDECTGPSITNPLRSHTPDRATKIFAFCQDHNLRPSTPGTTNHRNNTGPADAKEYGLQKAQLIAWP